MAGQSIDTAQQVADGLKSQGGTTSADGGDPKFNSSTHQGGGPDLTGHGSAK